VASRRNIYQGPGSVYARMEGVWAPGSGIRSLESAASIAALILRDYRRGWTYDHYGNVIPMTWDLARRRLVYLYPLAIKHGAPNPEAVRDLAFRAAATGALPPEYLRYARLEGPQARRVALELGLPAAAPAAAVGRRGRARKAKAASR
jgi:hypothetical protein